MRTSDRTGPLGRRSRAARPAPDPGPAGPVRLGALQEATRSLASGAAADAVLAGLLHAAAAALPDAAVLLATTSSDGDAVFAAGSGVPAEQLDALAAVLVAGSSPAPGAVVVDVVAGRRWHGRLAALPGPEALPADAGAVLESYAGLVAAVRERAVAEHEAAQEAARATALLGLGAAMAGASDPDAVAREAVTVVPVAVGCSWASVLLWDAGEGRLRTASSRSATTESSGIAAEGTPELLGMLTDRRPRVLRWESGSPALRAVLSEAGSVDALAVPLVTGGAFLGVAVASWPAGRTPARPEGEPLDRLRALAGQVAVALDRLRLTRTVHHQATHDALTGLPGRALLHERLDRALTAVGPEQHVAVVSCAVVDLGAIDDEHGAAGDEVLRQVAARLRAAIRPGDSVGRLAGAEFAVVLSALGTSSSVDAVVSRVRACFDEPFRTSRGPAPLAPAIGVAVYSGHRGPGDRGTADDLLSAARADRRGA